MNNLSKQDKEALGVALGVGLAMFVALGMGGIPTIGFIVGAFTFLVIIIGYIIKKGSG